MKKNEVELYDRWWYSADFQTMETITGYRQVDFPPDEGCQAFADACDEWWEKRTPNEKIEIRKENE
jgi:hypothetical protein